MPTAPLLRAKLRASLPAPSWEFVWFDFMELFCGLSQLLWVHTYSSPAVSASTVWLELFIASGSYGLSAPSSMTILEPWGDDAIEATFRIGRAIVSSSLYLDQLWVSDEGLEMPSSVGAEINHPMSFYYYVLLAE